MLRVVFMFHSIPDACLCVNRVNTLFLSGIGYHEADGRVVRPLLVLVVIISISLFQTPSSYTTSWDYTNGC